MLKYAFIRVGSTSKPVESPTIAIKRHGDYESWCFEREATGQTPYSEFIHVIASGLGYASADIHVQTICSDTGVCTDVNATCATASRLRTTAPPAPASRLDDADGGGAMWAVFTVPRAAYDDFTAWTAGAGFGEGGWG